MKEGPEMEALPADVRAMLEVERSLPPVPAPMRARIKQGVQTGIAAGGGSAGAATSGAGWTAGALGKTLATFVLGGLVGAGFHAAWTDRGGAPREGGVSVETAPAVASRAEPSSGSASATSGGAVVTADSHLGLAAAPPAPGAATAGEHTTSAGHTAQLPSPTHPAAHGALDDMSTLARERQMIDAARSAAAGGHPSDCLTILARYRSEFPRGTLDEERDALEIRALLALGRIDEGQAAASRFFTTYPESMLTGSLRRLVDRAAGTR